MTETIITGSQTSWTQSELADVSKWQKYIILILVLKIMSVFLPMIPIGMNLFVILGILLFIAQAYSLFKLAVAIKADFPILYALSCLIPWINLIVLLYGSMKATKILKTSGIKVGLFGAKMPLFDPSKESV